MLYEEDHFTQSLGNGRVINFTSWTGATTEYNFDITHMNDIRGGKMPYRVTIGRTPEDEDGDDEIVVDTIYYPTLEEAKAFIDGYLFSKENS